MVKKILYVVGILACLVAAEGLNRFGGFVRMFGGGDAPIYMGLLVISLVCAVLFVLAWVGKLPPVVKWIGVACLGCIVALMLLAPSFPVIGQIIGSALVALVCLFFAETAKKADA